MTEPITPTPAPGQAGGLGPSSPEHQEGRRNTFHRVCHVSFRTIFYGLIFSLIFATTVALLALVSYQLHKYGNSYSDYGSKEYKHSLGLLLFAVLISLIISLSHPWLSVGFMVFASLVAAVFFGTGAGVVNRTSPFKGTSCHSRPVSSYPPSWKPFAHECGRIVAIQGLAWALWALYVLLLVATIIHKFDIRRRPTPERFYFDKV